MALVKKITWAGNQEDLWVESVFGGINIESNRSKVKLGSDVKFTVCNGGTNIGEFRDFNMAELFANAYFNQLINQLLA
jgi:hypothetical protein